MRKNVVKYCPLYMTWPLYIRTYCSCGNLHKIASFNIPLCMGEGFMRVQPPSWGTNGCWRGRVFFFSNVVTVKLPWSSKSTPIKLSISFYCFGHQEGVGGAGSVGTDERQERADLMSGRISPPDTQPTTSELRIIQFKDLPQLPS